MEPTKPIATTEGMKYHFLLALVVGAFAVTLRIDAAQFTSPRTDRVEVFLRDLSCENTTEAGADEVYIMLLATSSDGRKISKRLPADAPHTPAGHWDMNDSRSLGCDRASGDSSCINNKTLATFDTTANRSWDATLAFMEEDRGLKKSPEEVLREGVERGGGDAIATLLSILVGVANNDSDDFIGSVVAHITPGRVDWRRGDRVRNYEAYPTDPNRVQGFSMIGDGANYTAHVGLR